MKPENKNENIFRRKSWFFGRMLKFQKIDKNENPESSVWVTVANHTKCDRFKYVWLI